MSELLLCLDTATPTARVAVIDGAGAVRFATEATAEKHSSHVLPLCAEALRAVGIAPADLGGIACGGGPGSFTGLRVGLSTVKGLALASGVPLYVVSSLQALALDILSARAGDAITAVPCLDAGKGEVYVGAYVTDGAALVRETAAECRLAAGALADWLAALPAPPPDIQSGTLRGFQNPPALVRGEQSSPAPHAIAGNGAERHQLAARAAIAGPTAVSVGRLALLQRARGEAANLASAAPNYGRPPDITVKKSAIPSPRPAKRGEG